MIDTRPLLFRSTTDFPPVQRGNLEILQVNLGYRCNLSCTHCHVNAGPKRTEEMSWHTAQQVLEVVRKRRPAVLDMTGGAPELNAHFRWLVEQSRAEGVEVIDRCNLTILQEPGQESLADFLAAQGVRVVASLPCYSEQNVDSQRGKGVFEGSIEGLKTLNALGYGRQGSGLILDLVYNPGGAFLPPSQQALEQQYKERLAAEFDIQFNSLLTLANMPISRFGSMLVSKGQFEEYMGLLRSSFNAGNLTGLMCRNTISVDWQGYLYDCDFNQMLNIPLQHRGGGRHLTDLLQADLSGNPVVVADHCFGCTAGQGSSCGGALD
ncbi:MAG: radical SAM protein [Pseudomonadales bacterium]|uniref:arsenosugar biosynthesis radical SAM (seleno)protein ArsS n=1 Tax=unclassified Ketobacter TaxID=2639109 RepID=UPI000C365854|nr:MULTISPECIES: arsenosugar biosynthesis radical SAM (seleno)protein ArsS [unclassified Ketobacter]MAA59822.1 radical SAM protein [Pseudomonadales bacterium]MEC8810530.1 arsenosugar biosynthesis radical SAM (seleno)protein ArsS [Pseudomonadota bacterium]TNC89733.1 MAG: radical SAM protein [Alcanivorax sp.]HAG93138.1 radical SAM protein [Gammaproteobacteria bacterium]MAQ25007.1 radical SAM protein [Pseudomonadales bacterium]